MGDIKIMDKMLDFGVLNEYNLNKIEFSQKWVGVSLTGPTAGLGLGVGALAIRKGIKSNKNNK